jgi:hypothetical protein
LISEVEETMKMNWINAFEVLCYIITALLVVDMVIRKKREELLLFLSSALAGYILELLAVRMTNIYHYSDAFYFSLGKAPYQFPFFGGMMWGGLAVCALRIAKKFHWSTFKTALLSGWLVVSMDLLLDVAAIRLNGGFWVWDGRMINLEVSHRMFMSVIWVNFLGYLFETPSLVYMSLIQERKKQGSVIFRFFTAIIIGLVGVGIVGILSALSLLLDKFTDERFSFLAFLSIWFYILVKVLFWIIKNKGSLSFKGKKDWTLFVFWAAIYCYCLVALWTLGIVQAAPLYGVFAVFLGVLTLALSLVKVEERC